MLLKNRGFKDIKFDNGLNYNRSDPATKDPNLMTKDPIPTTTDPDLSKKIRMQNI